MTTHLAPKMGVDQAVESLHEFLRKWACRPISAGGDITNDEVVSLARGADVDEADELRSAKQWQAALFDAGFAWLEGPHQYGGLELSGHDARKLRKVLASYETPNTSCFVVSHNIVGPTIWAHGTEQQRERWLRSLWRGDEISCQLFSEPDAGSDLASLRTEARRDGDEWVLTGQKVWSSGAHYSQVGEILVRTGSPEDRHRGITAFLIDMGAPGITCRRIHQMGGGSHFNEVFLDEVRVPDANRLGDLNDGWRVAMTTLNSERSLLADESLGAVNQPVARLVELARRVGQLDEQAVREGLAEAWGRGVILEATGARMESDDPSLQPPASVAKLMLVDDLGFYGELAGRIAGPSMIADTGDWGTYSWSQLVLTSPSQRIAGGTDEIQRNIVAERVLGLPKETNPTKRDAP